MQHFAIPYRGIHVGKNIEFQLNTGIPLTPSKYLIFKYMYMYIVGLRLANTKNNISIM